jgi:hypothetical protein
MPSAKPELLSSAGLRHLALKILRFGLCAWLVIEAVLWLAFRAPTDGSTTLHLKNSLPGLKEKVTYTFNERQMRTLNWTEGEKPVGALRMLCLGGESTLGRLQNAEDTWWGLLAQKISAAHGNVRVEAAANGLAPLTALTAARWASTWAPEVRPDIIFVSLGASDVLMQPIEYRYDPQRYNSLPTGKIERSRWKRFFLSFSQIARWKSANNHRREGERAELTLGAKNYFADSFAEARKRMALTPPVPNPFRMTEADPKNEVLDALKILEELAKSLGAQLIVTSEPCVLQEFMGERESPLRVTFTPRTPTEGAMRLDSGWAEREIKRYLRDVREWCASRQIPYHDVCDALPKTAENFSTDLILTDKGAEQMAAILEPLATQAAKKALGK